MRLAVANIGRAFIWATAWVIQGLSAAVQQRAYSILGRSLNIARPGISSAAACANSSLAAKPKAGFDPCRAQVVFNNTVTYYYLPVSLPAKISCVDYTNKLAFAFQAMGQPYITIEGGTGILINGTYTMQQLVTDTATNATGALPAGAARSQAWCN